MNRDSLTEDSWWIHRAISSRKMSSYSLSYVRHIYIKTRVHVNDTNNVGRNSCCYVSNIALHIAFHWRYLFGICSVFVRHLFGPLFVVLCCWFLSAFICSATTVSFYHCGGASCYVIMSIRRYLYASCLPGVISMHHVYQALISLHHVYLSCHHVSSTRYLYVISASCYLYVLLYLPHVISMYYVPF